MSYCICSCWPDKFQCKNKTCINIADRCDGIWDCPSGEDEASCNNLCHIDKFACKNKIECIQIKKVILI